MIPFTLRTRLTVGFSASLIAILVPVLAGLLALEWRSMRRALDHHLEEDLEVAVEMLTAEGSGVMWRTDATRDLGYDAADQRWVEVYSLDGQPLFFRGIPSREPIREVLPRPSQDTVGYRTVRTPAGANTRVLLRERRVAGTAVWLRVARSEDGLRQDLQTLVLIFALFTPLAVLGAAVAGHVISGRALAPLSRMAERARAIGAESLSKRLPVENANDELGQLAVVFNDTFARLEASFERLKRFSADASHQLRTPLTAIRSVGEVGLREAKEPRDYQEVIGSMLEEADRLAGLVDTLLTLSRWESGRVPCVPTTLDLSGVACDVAAQLSVLAEERRVTLDVDLPASLMVSADATMIRSAVMNVVDNAIKFTTEGGRVRLWGRSDARSHHLVVDDEGPGISEAQRNRVLERFYRVEGDSPDGVAGPGAGLGLAIADWALTANHGRVTIDSSDAGGARLILTLPRL